MKLSLRQQADAVELAFVNKRGHVRNLTGLVEKGRRPKPELDLAKMALPALEAACATLRYMEKHEPALRKLLDKQPEPDLLSAG